MNITCDSVYRQISTLKILPVITISCVQKATELARVLLDNGLPLAEITFRTGVAAAAIRAIKKQFPLMLIGAGTVLTTAQVDAAVTAGSDFIMAPALNPEVVTYALEKGITIIPGTNNPQTVDQAVSLGLEVVKLFPAEVSGGVEMLNALSAIYPVKFIPTGGINPGNLNRYLTHHSVIACGGSWMVPTELINNEDWGALGQRIRETLEGINYA